MNRCDPAVNGLSLPELKNVFFPASPVFDEDHDVTSRRFREFLADRPLPGRDICFISPPQLKPEAASHNIAKNLRYMSYPPHGFMYLAAAIRAFCPGWNIHYLDLNLETLRKALRDEPATGEELAEMIPLDMDLYCISIMFESCELESIKIMQYLKARNKFVVAGGVQATVDADNLLAHRLCDMVIKKEGETQIAKLLWQWQRAHGLPADEHICGQPVYNASFLHEGEVHSFPDTLENLLCLDIRGEYSEINLDRYQECGAPNIWTRIAAPGKKWATLCANRGCRGHCTFCQVSQIMGQGARSRAVGDIIDEILFLYHRQGVRHLEFFDDDFLANRDRSLEFLNALAALKLDVTFSVGAGVLAITFDEAQAEAAARAGCVMIGFGVETGNERRLKSLRKPVSLAKVSEACGIIKKNHGEIWLQANFIIGFPDETFGELQDTFNYAKELGIDYCQSTILTPILGTSIYEEYRSKGDDRIRKHFGEDVKAMHTPGRALVSRGLTFDDVYGEVYDFRTMPADKVLSSLELQQFQIFFNVFLNLVGSVNLRPGGRPEKVRDFTADVLKAYPMDPVVWGINARASLLLGDERNFQHSAHGYKKALEQSRFWSMFFEVYDLKKEIGLPV
jgi:radical SAM superfamily enzyme YgiQ (UPF0313 family)